MNRGERVAVVSVLSERERRVLAAAEALLLEHDEALVRSFDVLAGNDGGDGAHRGARNGPHDGTPHDGTPHDGAPHDGTPHDGARHDPAVIRAPAPRAAEPEPPAAAAPAPRRRSAPMYDGLLRTLFVLGLIGMLAVSGWIFHVGDAQIRLLTGLVMFPVLALTAFTMVVLSRRDRDGT